jgi:hypothetical protein
MQLKSWYKDGDVSCSNVEKLKYWEGKEQI